MLLALDVGGTFIKYICKDDTGKKLYQGKVPTPRTNQIDFLLVIDKIIKETSNRIDGIALSLPGTIDSDSGYVFQGGSLTYNTKCNLKEIMETRWNVPVEIQNDARCAAIAECDKGSMKEIENGMILTFGTGIGGCLILHKQIYSGSHFFAGEVSAMITKDIKEFGTKALWGTQGSIPNLCQTIATAKGVEHAEGPEVFDWIASHDPVAEDIFQKYCYDIVVQLFNLQLILDPQRIAIGGGVSQNPIFLDTLRTVMHRFYDTLPLAIPRVELVPCTFYNDANLIGAMTHFHTMQNKRNQEVKA